MRSFSTWNNTNSTGEWLESCNGSPTHGQTWPTKKKELARRLQQPTVKRQKKLKHPIRYLTGTKHYKLCISPTVQLRDDNMPLDVVANTDSDWAGWHSTQKSTTGFAIQVLGTTVHFGSRTQATVALKRRNRVLRHWNSNDRSIIFIIPQEFPTGDSRQQKDQH